MGADRLTRNPGGFPVLGGREKEKRPPRKLKRSEGVGIGAQPGHDLQQQAVLRVTLQMHVGPGAPTKSCG